MLRHPRPSSGEKGGGEGQSINSDCLTSYLAVRLATKHCLAPLAWSTHPSLSTYHVSVLLKRSIVSSASTAGPGDGSGRF